MIDRLQKLTEHLTLHDVAKDTGLFALFTSPWAFLAGLNWTIIFGVANVLILTFFRWRSLKLRERELELRHREDFQTIRARLSRYESVEDVQVPAEPQRQGRAIAFLSRAFRTRGTSGVG